MKKIILSIATAVVLLSSKAIAIPPNFLQTVVNDDSAPATRALGSLKASGYVPKGLSDPFGTSGDTWVICSAVMTDPGDNLSDSDTLRVLVNGGNFLTSYGDFSAEFKPLRGAYGEESEVVDEDTLEYRAVMDKTHPAITLRLMISRVTDQSNPYDCD